MPHLDFLHLEELEPTNVLTKPMSAKEDRCLDADMAIKAIWCGKEEIQMGLQTVLQSYCILEEPCPHRLNFSSTESYYLNLRYANLKVSPRYRLTGAEARALKALRMETLGAHPKDSLPAVLELLDDEDF